MRGNARAARTLSNLLRRVAVLLVEFACDRLERIVGEIAAHLLQHLVRLRNVAGQVVVVDGGRLQARLHHAWQPTRARGEPHSGAGGDHLVAKEDLVSVGALSQ